MKNKRTFVGLFVILALLCLGIGYAAISKTLTINGGVSTGDETALEDNFVVYFAAVSTDTSSAENVTVDATVNAAEKSTSTSFEIENMNIVGSKVILTYTIKNDSNDLYAFVEKVRIGITGLDGENITEVTNGTPVKLGENGRGQGYFNVTMNWEPFAQLDPKGGTTTLTVTVEMINSPINAFTSAFNIYFDCYANTFGYTS
jgi:hypothetical protein